MNRQCRILEIALRSITQIKINVYNYNLNSVVVVFFIDKKNLLENFGLYTIRWIPSVLSSDDVEVYVLNFRDFFMCRQTHWPFRSHRHSILYRQYISTHLQSMRILCLLRTDWWFAIIQTPKRPFATVHSSHYKDTLCLVIYIFIPKLLLFEKTNFSGNILKNETNPHRIEILFFLFVRFSSMSILRDKAYRTHKSNWEHFWCIF